MIAAVAALALTPSVASSLEERRSSVTLAEAPFGEVTRGTAAAKCRRGEAFAAGGFNNPEFGDDSFILPFSARLKSGRKWAVSAENIEAGAGTLASYAYCGSGERPRVKSRATQVEPFEPGRITAKCKRGQSAVSGGFANGSPDDPGVHPSTSRRGGQRRWTVSGPNLSGSTETLVAYVHCAADGGLSQKKRKTSLETGEQRTLKARCGRGSEALSGGFANSSTEIRVFESRRAGRRGWKVSGWASNPATLKAFVYCTS